jgi:hypothetical protein
MRICDFMLFFHFVTSQNNVWLIFLVYFPLFVATLTI